MCAAEALHAAASCTHPCVQSSLQNRAFEQGKRTPRGSAHDADPRGVLASDAVLSTPAPQTEEVLHHDTKHAANIDVLENGSFKPRPKLAESSSRQARLAPSQLVGDGGAAVDGEERLAARCRRIDHSERSEPEGVMPPSR